MRKVRVAAVAAVVSSMTLVAAGADAVAAAVDVDAASSIGSSAPVPGAFTAGQGAVGNGSAGGTLKAGTSFLVEFTQLGGGTVRGTTTVSSLNSDLKVDRVSKGVWRITLRKDMARNDASAFEWSDTHWFAPSDRDKVTMRVESLAGDTRDADTTNDVFTYTNGGRGF